MCELKNVLFVCHCRHTYMGSVILEWATEFTFDVFFNSTIASSREHRPRRSIDSHVWTTEPCPSHLVFRSKTAGVARMHFGFQECDERTQACDLLIHDRLFLIENLLEGDLLARDLLLHYGFVQGEFLVALDRCFLPG